MKEPECESALTTETDNDEDEEDEASGRDVGGAAGGGGGAGLQDQAQVPLSHVQAPEFSMDPQRSSAEGGSPLEGNADRPETGG